ncbi:MAG: O-antigen polymerase [Caldisericia bacterium]
MNRKLTYFIGFFEAYPRLCAYFLILLVGTLASFCVDSSKMGIVLLFVSSLVFTIEVTRKQLFHPIGFLSPLFVFTAISFLTYPLKLILYSSNPSQFFFFVDQLPITFIFAEHDYYITFLIFLIGFFSFYFGYIMKANTNCRSTSNCRKIQATTKIPTLNMLMLISSFLTLTVYFLQFKLGIGRIFVSPPEVAFKIVGITYYIFFTSQALLLPLYLFASIERHQRVHIFLAFLMVLVVVASSLMNLSKAGLSYPIFILAVLFVLNRDKTGRYPKKLFIIIIGLVLLFFVLYSSIGAYRQVALEHGSGGGIESLRIFIQSIGVNVNVGVSKVGAIFSRLGGLDVMLPIVSYGKDHALFSGSDLARLIAGDNAKDYFLMYKNILGLPPEWKSGFEITFMGFLYMYFRIGGIIVGMFLWGKFNRFIFEIIKGIYLKSYAFGASLFVIYIQWFILTTFGFGPNTHKMAVNSFIADVFIFLLWRTLFRIGFIRLRVCSSEKCPSDNPS